MCIHKTPPLIVLEWGKLDVCIMLKLIFLFIYKRILLEKKYILSSKAEKLPIR